MRTRTLYRPVGETELAHIARSRFSRFPPRLPGQPFFYPVCTRAYADQIARDWNTRGGGIGYVTRFDVPEEFLGRYERRVVGSRVHEEYWIPAEDIELFNDRIVGLIEVIAEYRRPTAAPVTL